MMTAIFIISVLLIVWAYAGYPLSMKFISDRYGKDHNTNGSYEPHVTIILAVADASDKIYDKLVNISKLKYPLLNVIVVMDGFDEETEKEINRFRKDNHLPEGYLTTVTQVRGGKESAQLTALNHDDANGEIIVFTDVGTSLAENTITLLVQNFNDDEVAVVDGVSTVVGNGHSNESAYLRYENKIRDWESRTCGLLGTGGCLFAVRKNIIFGTTKLGDDDYPGFVPDQQSDFRTALVAKTHGKKTVIDRAAVAAFADGDESKEYGRKLRTVVRGINTLMHNTHLLNPFKYGLFSYALISHKLLKWLVPFFMIAAYASNYWLSYHNSFWMMMWILQSVFYIMSFTKFKNKYGKMLNFFVSSNIAILNAWIEYWQGKRYTFWDPTKR